MLVRRFVTIFPAELKDLSTHADVAGTLNQRPAVCGINTVPYRTVPWRNETVLKKKK